MKMIKWNLFEKIWVIVFTVIILACTVYFSYSGTDYSKTESILLNWFIAPLSAITGIFCVVLVARGSLWNYFPGLVNCIAYGYLSYKVGYYGDMALNLFYFLPFQFIGFVWWRKHLIKDTDRFVIMKKLTTKQFSVVTVVGIISTVIIGLMLNSLDNWFVTVVKRNVSIYTYIDATTGIKYLGSICDSSTEILQIVAQILMVLAFREQWIMWILTNVITIFMWSIVIVADPKMLAVAVPTLIMWIAYLVNSIYGYYNWSKGAKNA